MIQTQTKKPRRSSLTVLASDLLKFTRLARDLGMVQYRLFGLMVDEKTALEKRRKSRPA